jgi:hypothetical protein
MLEFKLEESMLQKDRNILRDLAKRVNEVGNDSLQAERRERWCRHNALKPGKPMIYISPEGSWQELIPQSILQCRNAAAQSIETSLRRKLFYHEVIPDDQPIEAIWTVPKIINSTGWGIDERVISSSDSRGAWHFDPVIFDPADLQKIKIPRITYDRAETEKNRVILEDLFDGIIPVQMKGIGHIGYHLMAEYTKWRGLEEVMMDMYLNPEMLHEAMARLTEGHKDILKQYIEQDLLELNNDQTYQSSGGNGYLAEELPASDFSGKVRPIDMWASSESQELAQVGPKQHAEFALTYEKELLKPFGLTGYGCCEDLTGKLDDVFEINNLRRISISPWADVEKCAERLKGDYIFSWKPQPAHLVGDFNSEMIREYLRNGIKAAQNQGCILEIILKDTHTCQHHPERFVQWLQIAREEIEKSC